MKKDELRPIQSSESLVHKSETPMNQEWKSSEANNIVICEATGCFAKTTTSISIESGHTMKVSECLCDHKECTGQYMDSLQLGFMIDCGCVCHYDYGKVEAMDKVTSHPMCHNQQIKTSNLVPQQDSGVLRD